MNQLSSEFLGHALTFLLTPLAQNNCLGDITLLSTSVREINSVQLEFNFGSITANVVLTGGCNVRKTNIRAKYTSENLSVDVSPYSLSYSDGEVLNIASKPVSVGYYLRGFEFARQSTRMIEGKGDILPRGILNIVDKIVSQVSHD